MGEAADIIRAWRASSNPTYKSLKSSAQKTISSRPTSSGGSSKSLKSSSSKSISNQGFSTMYDQPYGDKSYRPKTIKNAPVGAGGIPPQTQSQNAFIGWLDNTIFRGTLSGGITPSGWYDELTEEKRLLLESKDRYESMIQMQGVADRESDYAYKQALNQAKLDHERELEKYRQELDASNQNWWEKLTKQETELDYARRNIAQEQEARFIMEQVGQLKEQQQQSSLEQLRFGMLTQQQQQRSLGGGGGLQLPTLPSSQGIGNAVMLGGLALVAVMAFKK